MPLVEMPRWLHRLPVLLDTLLCNDPSSGRVISMRGMVVCISESDTNAYDPD